MELGDGARALQAHDEIDPLELSAMLPERRASHLLDLARAYAQVGDLPRAGEMLVEADRLAPSEVRCRPVAHELASDLLRRTKGASGAGDARTGRPHGTGRLSADRGMTERRRVSVCSTSWSCGSPAARRVGGAGRAAQRDGWDVCVVTTPDGRKFVDADRLAAQTGHPVRSSYKHPGEPDLLPAADALVVAPATVNTINKWAAGIADTLALGLLVEAYGKGLPIVALPFTNREMAAHPAFQESVTRLRGWGVTVLFGGRDAAARRGCRRPGLDEIPWHLSLARLPRP